MDGEPCPLNGADGGRVVCSSTNALGSDQHVTTERTPSPAARSVRGSFYGEYVRMIRRRKNVDWKHVLPTEDIHLVFSHIESEAWYPMASFERLGVAILSHLEGATLEAVRMWGRFSGDQFAAVNPTLIARGDPVESLMRLKVQRSTLFNFPAFDIPTLTDGHALVAITYRMGPVAEEAACYQTMGFCEEVLSLAGATDVEARFLERAWTGQARTLMSLDWNCPSGS